MNEFLLLKDLQEINYLLKNKEVYELSEIEIENLLKDREIKRQAMKNIVKNNYNKN